MRFRRELVMVLAGIFCWLPLSAAEASYTFTEEDFDGVVAGVSWKDTLRTIPRNGTDIETDAADLESPDEHLSMRVEPAKNARGLQPYRVNFTFGEGKHLSAIQLLFSFVGRQQRNLEIEELRRRYTAAFGDPVLESEEVSITWQTPGFFVVLTYPMSEKSTDFAVTLLDPEEFAAGVSEIRQTADEISR